MIGRCAQEKGGARVAHHAAGSRKGPEPEAAHDVRFLWCSGDAAWIRAVQSEPLSGAWRRALESQRVVGIEPSGVWSHREVARLLAFPLRGGGENLGVLVAGIRRGAASLGTLERLELRAGLATSALLRLEQGEEAIRQETRQKAAVEFSAAAARTEALRSSAGETQERPRTELVNVIEWVEEGVVLFGANNEIRAMNTRFGQIVGLTPEESVEVKTLDALIDRLAGRAADPSSFAERWRRWARSMEGAGREELQLVRPVPRLLERAARPILDEKGALLGRVEIYRDLTAQRMFQSKLLQTEKLAALGQMVTGIAHELSNPLTSILGYAQRLLLRSEATGQANEARQIFGEAERASAILRQLLSTARDSRPERRRVALNQVVSRAVDLQRFSMAAEKVRVELDLEPVLPFVQGDSGQLQQVLMNLIGNARQAIEEQGAGGTIRVRTKRIAERRVLLQVSDTGPGIPQTIQARIFDPFFTTKPAGVGTGLGLAIALGIVREHGGQLHLTSPPGGGATFSVELPAMAASELPGLVSVPRPGDQTKVEQLPAAELRASAPAGGLLAPWAGMRVAVVEDEPTVARLIGDVLEDEGLRVDVLFDGREALKRVTQEGYDLVICDMKMPGLDGEHFFQTLAQTENPARRRFLFVTGDVLAARTREFLERNHLPHVAKPFRVEELTARIRSVLEEIHPREAARAPAARTKSAR
jgi:signal transduction histidine kinase/CheY-like chemotaxis protein